MIPIGNFFSKINNRTAREILFRDQTVNIIQDLIGEKVEIENVSIKNFILSIKKLSPSARNSLFIKKQKFLEEINKKQNIFIVKDVKFS